MRVAAIHDPRSIGIHRYLWRLSAAMADLDVDYRPVARPRSGAVAHFHVANSTRAVLPWLALQREPCLVTVHDVFPRARALRPIQRALVAPLCLRRASRVLVHSHHAKELLGRVPGLPEDRVLVVPFPATQPQQSDRALSRIALGQAPDGPPLFVLPGILKSAKLVRETLAAAAPIIAAGDARLLLAGRVVDESLVDAAHRAGATVIRDPADEIYEHVIVASDAVVSLRTASVGESNGPLLDAIGAGRPSLVTAVGSAPEVAGDCAIVVSPTVTGIRDGIARLLEGRERQLRGAAARRRAQTLSWAASGRRHAALLQELGDG